MLKLFHWFCDETNISAKTNNIKRCLFNALNQGFLWFLAYACYALAFWYGVGLIIEERTLPEDQRVYTPGNMMGVSKLKVS